MVHRRKRGEEKTPYYMWMRPSWDSQYTQRRRRGDNPLQAYYDSAQRHHRISLSDLSLTSILAGVRVDYEWTVRAPTDGGSLTGYD